MIRENSWLLPIVILIAGAVIAIALFMVRSSAIVTDEGDTARLRPITTSDHILGNPEAPVVVVEYSDIDCDYCKDFQQAMEQIITDEAAKGDVAWVYRHFPVIESHPNAAAHAEAAECVGSLGGNELFFRFIGALQAQPQTYEEYTPVSYAPIVSSLGLSPAEVQSCIEGTKFEKRVADDFDNAIDVGAAGAPYSVILIRGHDPIPVSGAVPYPALRKILDSAIEKAAQPSEN